MKKRLVSNNYIKKAYDKKNHINKIDLKEEFSVDSIDKIPKEMFLILGEALSFIENINNLEEEENEN
jgi:type III secretion system FlhB-like substrate exporter